MPLYWLGKAMEKTVLLFVKVTILQVIFTILAIIFLFILSDLDDKN